MEGIIFQAAGVAVVPGLEIVGHRRGTRALFPVGRIRCFFADGKYTVFRDGQTEYHANEGIGFLDACLSPHGFLRASRHALVNAAFIDGLRRDGRFVDLLLDDGSMVRTSKRRRGAVMHCLASNRRLLGKGILQQRTSPSCAKNTVICSGRIDQSSSKIGQSWSRIDQS
jgi:hypothetical protein